MNKSIHNISDQELISAFKTDPERSFRVILGKYKEPVYFQCRRILILHEDADDATQNTFVKVWNNLSKFKENSAFSTWLYRIAHNESLTLLKKRKKSLLESDAFDHSGIESTQDLMDSDRIEKILAKAIEALPNQQRMVFHYRYYDDLSFKEISTILGTSQGGLKANYHHAVTKIKKKLGLD